jgi:hypothetical protein
MCQQSGVLVPAEFQPPQHIQLGAGAAEVSLLILGHAGLSTGELRGRKRLEFYSIRSSRCRGIDKLQRNVEPAVVIDTGLGDHSDM